jgi:hypothetical protein
MPKFHSVTISFKPEYVHVYEFLKTKDNKSAYILRLITNDMNQDALKSEIKDLVIDILNKHHITLLDNPLQASEENLSDEEIDIIWSYF